MIWPYFWIAAMLGLILATAIAAFREKSARTKAVKSMAPQPMDMQPDDADLDQGFGEPDPVDSFGTDEPAEFAAFDDDGLK